jgi:hypothetical protein
MPLTGTVVVNTRMLTALRAIATGSMVDECAVTRGAGASTFSPFDPDTGQHESDSDDIYTGPCRVQPRATDDRVVNVGEEPTSQRDYTVSLPWDAPEIKVDDLVTVTASNDPLLVDRVLRVLDVAHSTLQTSRELVCEDTLG